MSKLGDGGGIVMSKRCRSVVGTLTLSMIVSIVAETAAAGDCNLNDVDDVCDLTCDAPDCDVPGCGTSVDCNANGIPDECDVVGVDDVIVFATGISSPEDIVASQGNYPPGFFVPAVTAGEVRHVSPIGGTVEVFSTGLSNPIAAVMVPPEFDGMGSALFVVSGIGISGGVVRVNPDGVTEPFAPAVTLTQGQFLGIAYIPSEVGGVLGGNLLVTGVADAFGIGNGRALLVNPNGDATVLLNRFGMPFWGPAIAPPDFGDYGGSIFIGVATGAGIYRIDPDDLTVNLFVSVPLVEELRGIRQIAFSPPGWAVSVDPALADQSVLVVSVASSLNSNDKIDMGAVMVWDATGKRVAVLMQGAGGINIEPRGLLFVENDLLISDIAEEHDWLLRATINSFAVPDCDGDGVPDACAIEAGAADCNGNGVPDACEPDCNDTGQPDDCDVLDGLSPDCDLNGFPDECEPDNDGDGIPDPCDRAGDFDHDSDVDLDDHELFAICLEVSGPGVSPPFPDCLDIFDFDADGDVDLLDAGGFERAFTGSIP